LFIKPDEGTLHIVTEFKRRSIYFNMKRQKAKVTAIRIEAPLKSGTL